MPLGGGDEGIPRKYVTPPTRPTNRWGTSDSTTLSHHNQATKGLGPTSLRLLARIYL